MDLSIEMTTKTKYLEEALSDYTHVERLDKGEFVCPNFFLFLVSTMKLFYILVKSYIYIFNFFFFFLDS